MTKKKGLVIIYDPHNLYQFIWYYCNEGKNIEWDALCLPNDQIGEYMHSYCENSRIFNKVYKYDDGFKSVSAKKKSTIFLQMLAYFLVGKRKKYCKKLINQYVDWNKYSIVVVSTSVGLVSGACVALSEEKTVIILEDGGADYWERKKWITWRNVKSLYHWQGFILSRMGYCCPGWYYFEPEKNCIKYSTQPNKMKYRIYKEIRQLYSEENTNKDLRNIIVNNVYPQIREIDFDKIPALLFTIPLSDFVIDAEPYREKLQAYLYGKYDRILLKRHPRDSMIYDFGPNTRIYEIDSTIPAEVIMPYLKSMDVYMCEFCSTVMYAQLYNLHCLVLIFDGYYEKSIKDGVVANAPSEEEVFTYVKDFGGEDCSVIKI